MCSGLGSGARGNQMIAELLISRTRAEVAMKRLMIERWIIAVCYLGMEQLRCQHTAQLEGRDYRGFKHQLCSRRLILLNFLKHID